ncbi:MAG: PTS glucose transporter subunit IIA [Coriobacteriaceae bacterium]|jgi:glucose-specific phosphotransferase system IIA component|nr:PTS glucose transporter subunit IIA [Olsenella sp.]MCI1289800.1 PTS glucose transporter subunit IIA [Olsenella sp.]RRF91274.1 MAG: PTS glucose transporter subunit IIA [Coriobacteriaceae bacterium]
MGFLERVFGGGEGLPAALDVDGGRGKVLAPVAGQAVPLMEVPDPVFASGALGVGMAIEPEGDVLFSPVDGVVSVTTGTDHAIGVTDEGGADILLHIGIDTVSLRGQGFQRLVRKGQHVSAGQPLMRFDPGLIRKSGLDSHVVVCVTNTEDLAAVTPAVPGKVDAGELVLAIEY